MGARRTHGARRYLLYRAARVYTASDRGVGGVRLGWRQDEGGAAAQYFERLTEARGLRVAECGEGRGKGLFVTQYVSVPCRDTHRRRTPSALRGDMAAQGDGGRRARVGGGTAGGGAAHRQQGARASVQVRMDGVLLCVPELFCPVWCRVVPSVALAPVHRTPLHAVR